MKREERKENIREAQMEMIMTLFFRFFPSLPVFSVKMEMMMITKEKHLDSFLLSFESGATELMMMGINTRNQNRLTVGRLVWDGSSSFSRVSAPLPSSEGERKTERQRNGMHFFTPLHGHKHSSHSRRRKYHVSTQSTHPFLRIRRANLRRRHQREEKREKTRKE